ncbi:hypothetical protein ACFLU6_06400 [Acidobacteriota bacterium]
MIRFLKNIPLYILLPANLLALLFFFASLIDPVPLDEVFMGVVVCILTFTVLIKLGSKEKGIRQAARNPRFVYRRLQDIQKLSKDIRKVLGRLENLPPLHLDRLKEARSKAQRLRKSLERLDGTLSTPAFSERIALRELEQLEGMAKAGEGSGQEKDLEAAAQSAREHLGNIQKLKDERESITAKAEKLYQQLKQTRSYLAAFEIKSVDIDEISGKIDEIHTSVNEFDSIHRELDELFHTADRGRGVAEKKEIKEKPKPLRSKMKERQ